jgi:hypothetical protein
MNHQRQLVSSPAWWSLVTLHLLSRLLDTVLGTLCGCHRTEPHSLGEDSSTNRHKTETTEQVEWLRPGSHAYGDGMVRRHGLVSTDLGGKDGLVEL